jgi:flagellar protein FlaF
MSQNNNNNNINKSDTGHANAAGVYDAHAKAHTPDQRELEARILLKAAKGFKDIQNNWGKVTQEEIDEVLTYNRQIWMMFVDTAIEDDNIERPDSLRNNIANLGVFIFKHTLDIISDPKKEKFDILIEINKEIAAGLMTKPDSAADSTPKAETKKLVDPTPGPVKQQESPTTNHVTTDIVG